MCGIPVKNRWRKSQTFLNKAGTNLCEIRRIETKNIPCQVEAERAGR